MMYTRLVICQMENSDLKLSLEQHWEQYYQLLAENEKCDKTLPVYAILDDETHRKGKNKYPDLVGRIEY